MARAATKKTTAKRAGAKRTAAKKAPAKKAGANKAALDAIRKREREVREKWRTAVQASKSLKKELADKVNSIKDEFKAKLESAKVDAYQSGFDAALKVEEKKQSEIAKATEAAKRKVIVSFDKVVKKAVVKKAKAKKTTAKSKTKATRGKTSRRKTASR